MIGSAVEVSKFQPDWSTMASESPPTPEEYSPGPTSHSIYCLPKGFIPLTAMCSLLRTEILQKPVWTRDSHGGSGGSGCGSLVSLLDSLRYPGVLWNSLKMTCLHHLFGSSLAYTIL